MTEEKDDTAVRTRSKLPISKPLLWVLGIMAGLTLILYIASYFIDEPLCRTIEKKVNRDLKGYSVGGIAKLLQNRPHEQVATKVVVSGPLQNPKTSTWQVIVQLIKNAFFKAILPTFERQVTTGKP